MSKTRNNANPMENTMELEKLKKFFLAMHYY